MDIESKFNQLGVDAIVGTQLMRLMNLGQNDFLDGGRFMRLKDVIDYCKSGNDAQYLVNKLTTGKFVDKLDHVWGYVELNRQKNALLSQMELSLQQKNELRTLDEQIGKYE